MGFLLCLLFSTSYKHSLSKNQRDSHEAVKKEAARSHGNTCHFCPQVPFGPAKSGSSQEVRHVEVGEDGPKAGVGHVLRVMPVARGERGGGAQKDGRRSVSAVRGRTGASGPGTVLRAWSDLSRHICNQLQHARSLPEGTPCPLLCTNQGERCSGEPAKSVPPFPASDQTPGTSAAGKASILNC